MQRLQRKLCDYLRHHLNGQPCRPPDAGMELLAAFGQLSGARAWHTNGPNPINFAEIEAWSRLMRTPLRPDHVRIIKAMDEVWIEWFRHRRAQAGDAKTSPPISQHPITANLLDAMLG